MSLNTVITGTERWLLLLLVGSNLLLLLPSHNLGQVFEPLNAFILQSNASTQITVSHIIKFLISKNDAL